MQLLHLNRRLHLYLALFLLPWFLLYAISSVPFSHGDYFEALDKSRGLPMWTKRLEMPYAVPLPDESGLREFGRKVLTDTGLLAEFGSSVNYGTYRQSPNQVNVYIYTFWRSTQVKYFLDEKKLVAEDRRFRWDQFLTGMHAQGGFQQDGWHDFWAVLVDFVCLGMLLWVVTGLVMWWKIPATRKWGWVALLSGIAAFATFLRFL